MLCGCLVVGESWQMKHRGGILYNESQANDTIVGRLAEAVG